MVISFRVNGEEYSMDLPPATRLIDLLRNNLGLTGTKEGCGEGECGTCTVIMDNVAVNSCLVPVSQIRGKEIMTVEGLEKNGELDALQDSFIRNGAVQCGFCTPGMLMATKALLMENPHPDEDEIRVAISGNLCRCTGYSSIINAVKDVAK